MTNGMSSQNRSITETERDSIYAKVQRGIINAERVRILQTTLILCDSAKTVQSQMIGIQQEQKDSLYLIIDKDNSIIKNLEENVKLEKKRGRRRAFWSFLKGTALGVLLTGLGIILL